MKSVFVSSFLFFKRLRIGIAPTRFTLVSVSDHFKTSSNYTKSEFVQIPLLVLVMRKILKLLSDFFKLVLLLSLFLCVYRSFVCFLISRLFCPLVCFALKNVVVFSSETFKWFLFETHDFRTSFNFQTFLLMRGASTLLLHVVTLLCQ